MLRRFTAIVPVFFLVLLVSGPALHAQLSTRATITGTVTDSSGAVVPGATVTITDDSTKVAIKTQSNSDGNYVAPGLSVATYSVSFAKTGFKSYTVTGIELHPASTATVNGVLAIGATTQTVTVQATSSEVETSTPETSADIDADEVSTLPMNGRNYQGVAVMMPGVTNLQQGTAMTTGGRSTSSQLSINGMAVARSFYAVDGVWNENTGNMTQESVIPNPDSLEEVRVLQNNFSAQYSLMGSSVILMQTKSGTAKFHATAWEFLRNEDLNSKPYFSTTIPPYKQNIFGYNVGGPVFIPRHYNADRQKTFFFWDEQFVVLHVPSQNTSIIPTANQKAGLFVSPIKDPVAGTLFPTNSAGLYQIPSGRINASSAAYLATLYPAPNYSVAGNANNYINNLAQKTFQRDDEIKIDHNFTPKYHALAEYLDEYQSYAQNTESPGSTPVSTETDFTHNKLAQVALTQALTPNMVNTTNVAMNIFLLNLTLVGTTDISQLPGFTETFFYPNAVYSTRTPVVSLSGGTAGQGIQAARPIPHASDLDNAVSDNWSWLKGKNYFTAGVTFVFNTKRQVSGQQTNGSLSFTGNSTKPATGSVQQDDAIADMLLGYVASFSQVSNAPHGDMHDFSWSPYAEDQFKLTKTLTLTLGGRLYHLPLPYGAPNSETNWGAGVSPSDPSGNPYNNPSYVAANAPAVNESSGIITPGPTYDPANGLLFNSGTSKGLPVNFSSRRPWYFAPDAGFAWDVRGDGKTSLRGGFGMSYTRIFSNQDCSFNCIANPPVLTSQNLTNLVFPSTSTWNITAAGGTAKALSVQSVTAADLGVQASPVASYSLGVQHEFPANLIASVVGAGSRIQHLVGTWNWNQPPYFTSGGVNYDFNPLINTNPANSGKAGDNSAYWAPYQGYGSISSISTRLWQEWNGLEAQLKHPMTKSLYVTAAYTWSHNTTNLAGNGVIDVYNLKRYHGNTESLNYPQSMAITVLYELPFFRNGNEFEKLTLGGWRINDITTFRSGTSLSPGLSKSFQGLAARPDLAPGYLRTTGPKTWKVGTSQQYFNTAAFVNPANGYLGNAQTGIIRGPGQQVHNLSLFKEFHIKEANLVEFRAEAFNVANHTNPSNPNTTLGNANYGKVTGSADPRILEFALRYKF
jgi:hypothetical protein